MSTQESSSGTDDPVKKLSLEGLPNTIIDQIFELVQSPELVKIASLSKSLYWPAVNRIYRNITVHCPRIEDDEYYHKYSHDLRDKREWEFNYGTVVKIERLEELICTLGENPQLAHLIKKVNIQGRFEHNIYAQVLELIPDLKSLHDDRGCLPNGTIPGNLESLTCTAYEEPKLLSSIVELRLIDNGEQQLLFQGIARNLITSQAYKTLRKLQFADLDYLKFLELQYQDDNNMSVFPSWTSFIDEFVAQGVKLDLTSLGLCGDLSNDKVRITQQLRKGMDLRQLVTLVSIHAESIKRNDTRETFTEMITKHTPRIDSLEICVTDESDESLLPAIVNTLTLNLPNQLKELCVSYLDEGINEGYVRDCISDAILSSQRNLVKLKIEDGVWFKPHQRYFEYKEDLEEVLDVMEFPWVSASACDRTNLFPCIMETPHRVPYTSDNNREHIYNYMDTIHESLQSDQIYTKAAAEMPFLTQYYYGRLFIDVKKRGLILNGKIIPFEDYSEGDFY